MERPQKSEAVSKNAADIERFTVKLQEQDHRFAMDSSNAVEGELYLNYYQGQAEVVVKVENLRTDRKAYKMFCIGRKKGNSVYKEIGELVPEKEGTAELRVILDPADVDGKGTALSCFYIFLMAAPGKPLVPVLKGDRAERNTVAAASPVRDTDKRETVKSYNSHYNEYIRQKTAELLDNSERNLLTSPFGDVWLAKDWRRVKDAVELPIASCGAQRQVKRYGHFIYAAAGKYFFLGIPGRHTEEDWPDRGASGFMMWQPIRDSKEYGYWCMVIDWKSGIITEIS